MKRTLLALMLVAVFVGGCHLLVHIPQSAFLSRFSLERSVEQIAYKGVNKSPGPGARIGGDVGMGGGTMGARGAKASLSSATAFMINQEGDNRFIESEFMEALTAQIKKEIEDNQATITGIGRPASSEFYVEYKDGSVSGRITISGSAAEEYYVLRAKVDESS